MHKLNRYALALSLAVIPGSPALAAEVKATGQLFSDYSIDLGQSLATGSPFVQTFSLTRARIGLEAKTGMVSGKIQTDVSGNSIDLRHAYAEADLGMGRLRGGQMSTGWSVPVEEDWFPYRFAGNEFSQREGLFPTEDRGVAFETGDKGSMVRANVGVYNGDGLFFEPHAKFGYNKAYEATVRLKPMDMAEIGLHARYQDAANASASVGTALVGFNTKVGPAVLGGEGGVTMSALASPSMGFGGSGHVYLPKLIPFPLIETPVVRVDYATDGFGGTANSRMRLIGGLAYEWAPGAETMLSYEHDIPNLSPKAGVTVTPGQVVRWSGGLKF